MKEPDCFNNDSSFSESGFTECSSLAVFRAEPSGAEAWEIFEDYAAQYYGFAGFTRSESYAAVDGCLGFGFHEFYVCLNELGKESAGFSER